MAERNSSSARIVAAVVALVSCLFALPASAQAQPLTELACKVSGFTPEDQAQISNFVETRLPTIGGPDQVQRERARKELIEPLSRPCVSVAFRQLYRAAMIDQLAQLAQSEDEAITINTLVILGELADDQARQVLQQYTADPREAVRYAAIAGLSRTFRAVNSFAPAIDAVRVSAMVEHLAERLAAEESPQIVDLITRALIAAAGITRDGYGEAATQAILALAEGVGPRLRAAEGDSREVFLISTLRTGEAMGGQLVGTGNTPAEIARAGAAFSAEVLAHLAFLANDGRLAENRRIEVDIANIAERVIVFAHQKMGRSITPPGLAALLEAGNDQEFYARTRQLVLSLEQPPVSLSPETMQRIRDALEGR